MTVAQKLEARGEVKGRKKEQKIIAKRLLTEKTELRFVSRMTGLTIEELKALSTVPEIAE